MSPKEETGLAGGCNLSWTSIRHNPGRPPMSASRKHPKLVSGNRTSILTVRGTAQVSTTKGCPSPLRIRSALKPPTPTKEPMTSTRAKQSPRMISVNAQSSSVVAPLRDGNAACMLFSQADLRLPRTAPLSARSYRSSDGFDGDSYRYSPCRGLANRAHSARAATSNGDRNGVWLASPSSGALPGASSSSPPRLAALSPTALTRPISPSGKPRTTKRKPNKRSGSEAAVVSSPDRVTAAALGENMKRFSAGSVSPASESEPVVETPLECRGFEKGSSPVTRRYTALNTVSPMETPVIVGEADYGLSLGQQRQKQQRQKPTAIISGLVKGERGNNEGKIDPADTRPAAAEVEDAAADKTRSLKSPKSKKDGTHAGSMSVAEFADKVAAFAAEVAKVFGKNRVSQSVDCRSYGLE